MILEKKVQLLRLSQLVSHEPGVAVRSEWREMQTLIFFSFFCRTVAFQACLKCRHSIKANVINQFLQSLMTIEHQCQSEHVFSWMRIYTPDANKGDDKEVNLRFMNEVLKCWSSKMNIKDRHDLSTSCSEMTEGHLSKCKHSFSHLHYTYRKTCIENKIMTFYLQRKERFFR